MIFHNKKITELKWWEASQSKNYRWFTINKLEDLQLFIKKFCY